MNTAFRADEDLLATAAKLEASAARAEARGYFGRARSYRRRAEELRAQLSANAKAWFETWSAKAEQAAAEAAECEAAGDHQGRAYGLRREAENCRFTACRFDARKEDAACRRRRGRVTVSLSQHALDVLADMGISTRSTRTGGSLTTILEEGIYALEEMRRDSVWFLHLRFHATARQQDRPRAWERAEQWVRNAGEIEYQLAKAEHASK